MKSHPAEKGLTLLEVAIAVLIVGMAMAAILRIYNVSRQQQQVQVTQDNMDRIVQALSVYAETAGRVPCPADPEIGDSAASPNTYALFGWEYGTDMNGDGMVTNADIAFDAGQFPVGSCGPQGSGNLASGIAGAANPTVGIVPFMALGLPHAVVLDGWGRYFTYAVSPAFARRNDQSSAMIDSGEVHSRCRHMGWVSISESRNKNPIKARFCCADNQPPSYNVGTDLRVLHTDGVTELSPVRANTASGAYGAIEITMTNPATGAPVYNASPIVAPAIVLVSHGENGHGAYLANGSSPALQFMRGGGFAALATYEEENANSNRTFADGPRRTGSGVGNTYFDDIVRWLTQDGLLAAHGALSCQYP